MAIAVKITSPQGAEEIVPLAQGVVSLDAVAGASYRLVDTESREVGFEAIIRRLGDDLVIDVLGTDADVRLVDYFFVCELDYRGCSIELDSIGGPPGEVLTPDNTGTTQLSDGSVLLWATPPASAGVNTADQSPSQEAAPVAEASERLVLSEGSSLPWGTIGLAGGGILALAALAGGGGDSANEENSAVGSDGSDKTDTTAPDAPTIDAVTGDDLVSAAEAAAGVAITGTAEAGATVTAQWGESRQSGQADSEGRFVLVFAPDSVPSAGVQSLTVSATDSSGNISETAVADVRISSGSGISITGVIDDVAENEGQFGNGAVLNDAFPTLIGVLDSPLLAGQSVQIVRNGVVIATAEVEGLNWAFTNGRLADGSYSHVVRIINADGSVAAVSDEPFVFEIDVQAPSRPTIDAVDTSNNRVSDETAADGVQVSGEAEAGSTITVTWGDVSRSAQVGSDGEWLLTYDVVPVENGRSVIRAVAEDEAGNQSQVRAEFVRSNVSEDDDDDADGSSVQISSADLLESSEALASLNLSDSEADTDQSDVQVTTAYANDATLGPSGSALLDDTFTTRIDSGL